MKLECGLENLKKILPVIDRITGKNLTLQILSSVLLIANGKTLKIRATNLDLGIEVEIPVKIEKEGVVAIKSSVFNNFLNSLHNEKNIFLELQNDNLKISSPSTTALLKTQPHADFPTIPTLTNGKTFSIEAKKLISGISSVFYSASLSDIKPEIATIYIHHQGDELIFVATDSFRLAEKRVKIKNTADIEDILIPFKNINEIVKVLELCGEKEVKIVFSKNQISFFYENTYLTSRLIDGIFPDYAQIIPKEYKTTTTILKDDLANALKSNNLFTDKFNQVSISVDPTKKELFLYTKSGEVGEIKSKINGSFSGEKIQANFNYRYLFDVFQSIQNESITLSFVSESKPVTIQGVGDQSFLYLVMPLNR